MRRVALALFTTLIFLVPMTAFADEDCECPENFSCELVSFTICEEYTEPVDCMVDEEEEDEVDCVMPEPGEGDCYEVESYECIPVECESDADCSGDGVCVEFVYEWCSMPGCGPEEDSCATEAECGVETEQICVPPYQAPCDVDTDCGDGFTCEARHYGCPDVSHSDGDDPVSDDDLCGEPDEDAPKRCVLISQSCDDDSDCDGGFVCHGGDQPACPTIGVDPDDEPGSPMPCEEVSGFCAPEDYYYHGGGGWAGSGDPEGEADVELMGSSRVDESAPPAGGGSGGSASACATVPTEAPPLGFVIAGMLLGMVALRRR